MRETSFYKRRKLAPQTPTGSFRKRTQLRLFSWGLGVHTDWVLTQAGAKLQQAFYKFSADGKFVKFVSVYALTLLADLINT